MSDQKTQSNLNCQPQQAHPEQATPPEQMGQQTQPWPAAWLVHPFPRAGGRRPPFRSN